MARYWPRCFCMFMSGDKGTLNYINRISLQQLIKQSSTSCVFIVFLMFIIREVNSDMPIYI